MELDLDEMIINTEENEIYESKISNENILKTISNELSENIYDEQKSFLESNFGKVINSAIDIGIKSLLPNIIEDEVIDIKNAILENGFKDGLKEVIDSGLDFGKSAAGILTGNFESISQVELAVKKGGIIDGISNLLDIGIDFAKKAGFIDISISSLLKKGKNTILNAVENKVEGNLTNQLKNIEKIEKYCEAWKESFINKDIEGLNKNFKKIKNKMDNILPIEKIIKEARQIENLQNLLINNGYNFNISEDKLLLANRI